MKTCPECDGDGVIQKGTDDEQQCPSCGGSGFVPDDEGDNKNEEVIRTAPQIASLCPADPRMLVPAGAAATVF